jgi:hypothetical protein
MVLQGYLASQAHWPRAGGGATEVPLAHHDNWPRRSYVEHVASRLTGWTLCGSTRSELGRRAGQQLPVRDGERPQRTCAHVRQRRHHHVESDVHLPGERRPPCAPPYARLGRGRQGFSGEGARAPAKLLRSRIRDTSEEPCRFSKVVSATTDQDQKAEWRVLWVEVSCCGCSEYRFLLSF